MVIITEKDFPEFIKKIRQEKIWSVSDMAEYLKVSPRTVEGWEQGRQPPKALVPFINLLRNEAD